MAFYRLSRTARSLRHRHSSLSTAHTYYFQSPIPLNDSSRHSRHLFQVSGYFHSDNQFYNDSNSFRSIGSYHRLLQYSSFSTAPPDEKREESKNSKGIECDRSWIDVYLPEKARPYARLARLDKPIGTWLLAWPCMWSITMAAAPANLPAIKMMMLFGTGALLLRGAGCTINDLLDRDIDTKVARTRSRPIASGVLSPFQGLCFLGFQLLLGLEILLQLNNFSRVLGASSLLLVFSYPLMKRLTYWPQAYLGLTFNWGALLGWAAIRGSLDLAVVIPLYASGVFWTLVYDTIYAHQDKEDDMIVGVKSTALRFADSTKEWISGFGAACIGSLALSGYNANLEWTYYIFLAAGSTQLAWQILTVDLSSRADCNRKFVSNKWFGAIICSGILFGRLFS
ncbi:4-hydroxybenzoate polyprenyltransferase, mitochondrial-like [Salvia splendens]|uniref:4-hydroxybenzoate polyprenyltransferase, mitochondrial-like n=1 Tax=Salvia splendens TaxID=180675 RepID=UPI001C268FCE|nr:4-hydroxybenzoate polyprenyltransferase, mitochondrial-like [Salvia splendens]XP_042064621.1 4-hydroxybenzoate polyprenyltransferase, mitochondrial-like [Salvia splendens]